MFFQGYDDHSDDGYSSNNSDHRYPSKNSSNGYSHDSFPGAYRKREMIPSYEAACNTAGTKDYGPVLERKEEIREYAYNGVRLANLGGRPKNIILFGETGVGKSSVINLMAGDNVAETSSNLEGCTLDAREYSFTFPGAAAIRIFDTVGLEEPEMGVNTFLGAIVKARQLVASLDSAGGIDLLLFCVRGGRITTAMQRTYHLFSDILCGGQVPLAIVVTNLEQEEVMENWWVKNAKTFLRYRICSVDHACITAVPAHMTMYAQKREESRGVLRTMLLNVLSNPNGPYKKEARSWFAAIVERLRSFLTKKSLPKKKDLLKKLETEYKLPRSDAEKLAKMLTEKGD